MLSQSVRSAVAVYGLMTGFLFWEIPVSSAVTTSVATPPSFTEGPLGPMLYRMTLPMVWGLLATMSFNAIDTLFVAQLGEDALAAMSFTFPVVMVMTSIGIGLGAGVSSIVSRSLGSGDQHVAGHLLTDSATFALLLSLIVSLLGYFTIEPMFVLLGATEDLLPMIREYMTIWYFNAPLLIVGMAVMSALRARGSSGIAGYLMLFSALANGALDPLLIFGLWGFPRLEIAGAAWATVISRGLMVIAVFWYVQGKFRMLESPFQPWSKLVQSWQSLLHIGVPAMATNVIIPLASGVVVALVAQHGQSAVAGFGVAMRIEPVALIVFYSLSSVAGPFFGQNLGANNIDRMYDGLKVMGRFCVLWGVCMAVVLWFSGEWLAGWFSRSEEVLPVAVAYLTVVPISYGLYGIVMSVNAGFNGLGQPMPGVMISAARVFVIYLPLAWVGQHFWGLQGLFVATALANAAVGVMGWVWMRHSLKRLQRAQLLSQAS
jgi:MATE family, multidrug efflux pump